jgi:pyridinium-3,5-biscarboxylic acid mononucleotide sulfurtransferase
MQEILDSTLQSKIEQAVNYIRRVNGAVVALSAGVDSSLVAILAKKALGQQTLAVTGVSESLASTELEIAERTARDIGIEHITVETDELRNPSYVSNSGDRCYHCKQTLYHELRKIADSRGYEAILDGTQKDDLGDHRPGLIAAREQHVLSPLLYSGFSKNDVRAAAKSLGLAIWDKPAMPCLSSRVPEGETVTVQKLQMIDKAESYLRKVVPVHDLRVRNQMGMARIEVAPEERHLFFEEELMTRIDRELRRIGFSSVSLDLKGYSKSKHSTAEVNLPIASR